MKFFRRQLAPAALLLIAAVLSVAQQSTELVWTPFGNTAVVAGVAGVASGPVDRVWRDGEAVLVALPSGEVFRTVDFQTWEQPENPALPARDAGTRRRVPGIRSAALVYTHPMQPALVYAIADQVYRSDDAGESFSGLTRYRQVSLIGDHLADFALNPADPNELLVASDLGLWRSRDGGLSWLNVSVTLANLPLRRIASFPRGTRGLRVETQSGEMLEWVPGAVHGYRRSAGNAQDSRPPGLARFGETLSAWDAAGSRTYASVDDGRLLATGDDGRTWLEFTLPGWGAANQILANPNDDRMALAFARNDGGRAMVLRTLNGGEFWEDWTPVNLSGIQAIAADWERGALFAYDGERLWIAEGDLRSMSRLSALRSLRAEAHASAVLDMRVDASGAALFAVTAREGVFTAPVPALAGPPRVRNAADLSQGPAAPGSLLSLYGAPVTELRANGRRAALLGSAESATQVQLPYAIASSNVQLDVRTAADENHALRIELRRTAPAVFLHPDGNPFVLHAESGLIMDESSPLAPGERVHVLLSGMGGVTPDWPAGLPAPAENPPTVNAVVEATVNGTRVPVTRATLAPGYAGIYVAEIVLPSVMDEGIAELQVLVDGVPSNAVPLRISYDGAGWGGSIVLP